MTPEEIAALEALANTSSPGPWRTGAKVGRTIYRDISASPDPARAEQDPLIGVMDRKRDAAFIASARTAVPALIAALREAGAAYLEDLNSYRADRVDALKRAEAAEAALIQADMISASLKSLASGATGQWLDVCAERNVAITRAEAAEKERDEAREMVARARCWMTLRERHSFDDAEAALAKGTP